MHADHLFHRCLVHPRVGGVGGVEVQIGLAGELPHHFVLDVQAAHVRGDYLDAREVFQDVQKHPRRAALFVAVGRVPSGVEDDHEVQRADEVVHRHRAFEVGVNALERGVEFYAAQPFVGYAPDVFERGFGAGDDGAEGNERVFICLLCKFQHVLVLAFLRRYVQQDAPVYPGALHRRAQVGDRRL